MTVAVSHTNAVTDLLVASIDQLQSAVAVMLAVRNADGDCVDLECVYANASAAAQLGMSLSELVGVRATNLIDADAQHELTAACMGVLATGEPLVEEGVLNRHGPPSRRMQRTDLRVTRVGDGLCFFWNDVTDLYEARKASEEAWEAERLTRMSIESAAFGMALADRHGNLEVVNRAMCELLGYSRGELTGLSFRDLSHPEDLPLAAQAFANFKSGLVDDHKMRMRYLNSVGDSVWVDVSVGAIRESAGQVERFVVQAVDVTEQEQAKNDLARSEQRFRLAMAGAPQGMAIADMEGRFTMVNPAMCRLFQATEDQLIGTELTSYVPADEQHLVETTHRHLTNGNADHFSHDHRLLSGGRELWIEHSVGLFRDDDGNPQFYVHQFADHTAEQQLRAELTYQASHDHLTGLPNRANLMLSLRDRLQPVDDGLASGVGVLFCDVDNLKQINDALGHKAGDTVLAKLAQRMRRAVRAGDVVARFSGDEFVVVLDRVSGMDEVNIVAEKIRAAAQGVIDSSGGDLTVSLSIGATLATNDEDPDSVLSRADAALYRAKTAGRNRVAH